MIATTDNRNSVWRKDADVRGYQDAFQVSIDFVSDYWDVYVRLYDLWRGKRPSQLSGTFSQIMLQLGWQTEQDRSPKIRQNIFSSPELFDLEAKAPEFEPWVEGAENFLRDLYLSQDKVNIEASITPTIQSTVALGTAYRMPCISRRPVDSSKPKGRWEKFLTSRPRDIFQILPSANGGLVNPHDKYTADATDFIFDVDWWTDGQIKALESLPGYNKDGAEALFKTAVDTQSGINDYYHEIYKTVGGVQYGNRSDWRERMRDIEGVSGRRRITHWFRRDKWIIIAQDNFKIYSGPPPLPGGILPLSKLSVCPDMTNWFGIGTLEMTEDMIIAQLLNFNFRMDHLARVMFPTKWIRSDLMAGKPESEFYDRPYAVHQFPVTSGKPQDMFFYDRAPEVTPQTFIEEDRLMARKQAIEGLPNYSKGMGGEGTLANDTATGIVSLIRQAEGRLNMESIQFEQGIIDELRLLMLLGSKHVTERQTVRAPKSQSGFPWSEVDPEIIGDFYTVRIRGTRTMAFADQAFQKALALYPFWGQDPGIDQHEWKKQISELGNFLPDPKKVLLQPTPAPAPAALASPASPSGTPARAPSPGGMASAQDVNQQTRSVANRNTVQPNTGNTVPANAAL